MNKRLRRLLGIKKAKRVYDGRSGRWFYHDFSTDDKERAIRYLLHTRKPCSCPGCGNPRRHEGEVTKQELFSLWELQEQLKELE